MVLHKRYSIAGNEGKATERSPLDKFMQWIITQSKSFTRKGIRNISRFLWSYIYLVLTSQAQVRSVKLGNFTSVVDAQQVYTVTFKGTDQWKLFYYIWYWYASKS